MTNILSIKKTFFFTAIRSRAYSCNDCYDQIEIKFFGLTIIKKTW